MSFELTKALSLLLFPETHILLGTLLALLLVLLARPRAAFLILLLSFAWFYTACTASFGSWLMERLEAPYPPVPAGSRPTADAIILLGGGVHARKSSEVLGDLNLWSDRLLYTAALYQAGKASTIIVTGGSRSGFITEADLTRDILEVMGVPGAALILERRSRNTHDNARFTAPIVRREGFERVLLVTSAFHMRRAVALFQAQGIEVIPAATDHQVSVFPSDSMQLMPTLVGLTYTHYALHEMAGYLAYRLRGWL